MGKLRTFFTTSTTVKNLIFAIIATIVFLAVSISGLEKDVINPDGINWHNRSAAFIEAFIDHHYSDMFQVYHPGITLMWISAPTLRHLSDYYQSMNEPAYSKKTYNDYDYTAKLTVVLFSALLFFISLVLIQKVLNFQGTLIYSVLAIFEPFMVGERRLYHLDYLMTYLILTSFISFYVYFYKSLKLQYLIMGCAFFVLSVLTKSTAIIFLPFPLMMGFFSREKLWKRLVSLPLFIIFIGLFVFAVFPPIWKTPKTSVPKYAEKIFVGINDIGYMGKKEQGFSGTKKNIILDEVFSAEEWYFYFEVLAFKTSYAVWVLAIASALVIVGLTLKFIAKNLIEFAKSIKATLKRTLYLPHEYGSHNAWLGIYAFLIFDVFFTALTMATKKGERYGVVFIPFLLLIIAQIFSFAGKKLALLLSVAIILSYIPQYIQIYPYFFAYGNPLLGGVREKFNVLDSEGSFGVGIKQVYDDIKQDRMGETGLYTIAGPKSLKVIADGAKFTKSPNCTTDYYVAFSLDDTPETLCLSERYSRVSTVKVGNMDYWYIFKKNGVSTFKGVADD